MTKASSDILKFVLGSLLASAVFSGSSPKPAKLSRSNKAIKARLVGRYLPLFQKYAGKSGKYKTIPLQLALALAHGEGVGDPNSVSRAGAVGLMQLMPKTARGLGLRVDSQVDERLDPEKNVEAGLRLIAKELLPKYKNWDKVLAAYNSGNPDPVKRREYINYIYGFLPLYSEYKGK